MANSEMGLNKYPKEEIEGSSHKKTGRGREKANVIRSI
jgi:hypothetical protein